MALFTYHVRGFTNHVRGGFTNTLRGFVVASRALFCGFPHTFLCSWLPEQSSWLPNDVRGAFTNTLRGLHEHCSWWLNEHCSVASHTRFSVRGCPNTVRGFQTMFVVASRTTSWPPRTWSVASPRAAACMFDFQA